MKLKEWAEKTGVKYLTAYRWFKAGTLPVKAYQTDSGTIIVEEEPESEKQERKLMSNNAMSLFLKKTVEFSKNEGSLEDFAAWVLANFSLESKDDLDFPKYSRNKPRADEVQKHFQQFLPDKNSIEHLKAVKTLLKEGKTAGDVVPAELAPPTAATSSVDGLLNDEHLKNLLASPSAGTDVRMYGNVTEGLVTRSVDFDTTPQQINYTGSTSQTFSSSSSLGEPTVSSNYFVDATHSTTLGLAGNVAVFNAAPASTPFQPTLKELQSATQVIETAEVNKTQGRPRKRGRKPSKKR